MPSTVLSHEEMDIETEDDVAVVRKQVRTLAEQRGFNTFAAAALTTATSEPRAIRKKSSVTPGTGPEQECHRAREKGNGGH